MMKKYKWSLLLSSLVILLPVAVGLLLWDRLPDIIPIHWGVNGQADGDAGPWFVVFLLPLILLALQWLCVWITFRDPKAKDQNPKAMNLALWIVPSVSVFSCFVIYVSGLYSSINLFRMIPLFLGAVLLVVGNYMPKTTQNSYLGVKNKWTLYSEENWNATHRFCGKVWVICGLLLLPCAFLPEQWMPFLLISFLIVMVLSCTLYSYFYYGKQIRQGMSPIPKKPLTKKRLFCIAGILLIVLVLVAVFGYIMFTGEIQLCYEPTFFTVEADFWSDLTVDYDAITSIEYLQEPDFGTRVNGFASLRLLMGSFHSETYGNYTLYAYAGCDTAVLLRSEDRSLMITGKTPEYTLEIYQALKERIQ